MTTVCGSGLLGVLHPPEDGHLKGLVDLVATVAHLPTVIAFGSCHSLPLATESTEQLWDAVRALDPSVFVWTGDVVYADHRKHAYLPFVWTPSEIERVRETYKQMEGYAPYAAAMEGRLVLGMGDDHDLNCNNGDKTCAADPLVKEALLRLLGETEANSPRWQREGLYASYLFREASSGESLSVILLDTRSFRVAGGGELLGERQWMWLERQLQVPASVVVLVSSVQVLPPDKPLSEGWIHHPLCRLRLLEMLRRLASSTPSNRRVVLISGDIHSAELLWDNCSLSSPLLEVTSSGMTHSIGRQFVLDAARSRLTAFNYPNHNFGSMAFDWTRRVLSVRIHDSSGHVVGAASDLSFSPEPAICNHPLALHREAPFIYLVMIVCALAALVFLIWLFTCILRYRRGAKKEYSIKKHDF
ncbi:MAG: alkaline phosphatase D family protein [archaeon]|nr:alkaline phosphatase D family protein [archaeon]